jgi:predicted nuclease of predicted toxin-antitoxin system
VKFLVDNQLPVALAEFLRERGHEARHVLDLGMEQADDRAICEWASTNEHAVISKDEDFFYLASEPDARFSLVWVRLMNCRNPVLLKAFGDALANIVTTLENGQRVVELRP